MDNNRDDPLPTIFNLIVKQQRVSEQTNRLMEGIMTDVSKVRDQSEKIAILINRVETMERSLSEIAKLRNDCITSMTEQFKVLNEKREQNKDRISMLEQQFHRQMGEIRSDYMKDLDKQIDPVEAVISDLREKVAFNAGKYGGIVALVVSVVMMLIQWVITHQAGGVKP